MFNMLHLSIELQSAEKSYKFPFTDTSLDSVALNPVDILPRQNWVGKLTFLLSALNLKISFPLTTNNYYQHYNVNSSKILCLL